MRRLAIEKPCCTFVAAGSRIGVVGINRRVVSSFTESRIGAVRLAGVSEFARTSQGLGNTDPIQGIQEGVEEVGSGNFGGFIELIIRLIENDGLGIDKGGATSRKSGRHLARLESSKTHVMSISMSLSPESKLELEGTANLAPSISCGIGNVFCGTQGAY